MKNKRRFLTIMPVLLSFFIMGFCDIVGISSDYAQASFGWSHTMTGLIPFATFVWFFFLSIPVSIRMNTWGRKNTVLLSLVITAAGMFIPLILFNSFTCIIAYACMGIGNAILQVSLNPLLSNVITKQSLLTGSLTLGQVIKAISSFVGPFMILFAVKILGNGNMTYWYYVFPVMGTVTIVLGLWLWLTQIEREEQNITDRKQLFRETYDLLRNKQLLLLFLGIFFVVGVDVATNFISSKLMTGRFGWTQEQAGKAPQLYFICRTAGALLGAWILCHVAEKNYFRINILACAGALLLLMFSNHELTNVLCIGAVGFFASCIFPIIYSLALQVYPGKANRISGLMITAVAGAGVVTPLLGVALDIYGLTGAISVILLCVVYLIYCAFSSATVIKQNN